MLDSGGVTQHTVFHGQRPAGSETPKPDTTPSVFGRWPQSCKAPSRPPPQRVGELAGATQWGVVSRTAPWNTTATSGDFVICAELAWSCIWSLRLSRCSLFRETILASCVA